MRSTNARPGLAAIAVAAAMLVSAVVLAGCSPAQKEGPKASAAPKSRELTLVAYSIPKKAYTKILPAFKAYWKDKTGEDVTFRESYGASGSQARAVIDGLEADVVQLAMEPDVSKIASEGLIADGWQQRTPNNGVPTTSLIVFGVRPGNPRGIADWADLSKDGVGVITPDPKSSGGARWNLLGSWGSVGFDDKDQAAYAQVEKFYANTLVLDKSARDASNTFLKKGLGDAAVLWESDANIAKDEGGEFEIVYPANTILAETAVSVVDKNADKHDVREVAEAFVEFLYTPEAQEEFAKAGLRPVDEDVLSRYADKYPKPSAKLYTISDFGGWQSAGKTYFGDGGVYARIEAAVAAKKK